MTLQGVEQLHLGFTRDEYWLKWVMQFEFQFRRLPLEGPPAASLVVGGRVVPLTYVRHRRARRYVLRLEENGAGRVTIPRGGSMLEATRFAERNIPWLEKQLLRQAARAVAPAEWAIGTEIFFRGARFQLERSLEPAGTVICFSTERVILPRAPGSLRPPIERHLWRLAKVELAHRVNELATQHQLKVGRVTVRNQRSRWGSCSRRGTISLNWRLIQTPESVRDYIILHELAHLKEMNHSRRFWAEVLRLCPNYAQAESWLKQHGSLLATTGNPR